MPEDDNAPDPADALVPMLGYEPEEEWSRPRGLYTGTDRKYLWGVETYEDSPAARSRRRREIRERTRNGIRDLFYLTMIEDDQQEKLVDELNEEAAPGELRDAVAALVRFLYQRFDDGEEWLEAAVADGVMNALMSELGPDTYGYPEVNVDIEAVRGPNLDDLERKLADRPYSLNSREIGILVRTGRIDPENVEKLHDDNEENPTMGSLGSG